MIKQCLKDSKRGCKRIYLPKKLFKKWKYHILYNIKKQSITIVSAQVQQGISSE